MDETSLFLFRFINKLVLLNNTDNLYKNRNRDNVDLNAEHTVYLEVKKITANDANLVPSASPNVYLLLFKITLSWSPTPNS